MSRDYVDIASAPYDEDCVQVDPKKDYLPAMRAECQRFIDLIRKKLGPEPAGARLAIKSNSHDFGSYLEVVCYYDDADEQAAEYAGRCESDAPRTWDDDKPPPDPAPAPPVAATGPMVCASCQEVAYENLPQADPATAATAMMQLGLDLEDHECTGGECACACNVARRKRPAAVRR